MEYYLACVIFLILSQVTVDCHPSNSLINGNFSANVLTYGASSGFKKSIDGWECHSICQVTECHYYNIDFNCMGNYINLDSLSLINRITQVINVNASKYVLEGYYYYPDYSFYNKTLLIYFN